MFRLRDHIISLVAVFLALGLGILIGTGLSEDMLVTQQRLLIEQMTDDFRSMREERNLLEARIQALNRDLYLWEKYQQALYPAIVPGFLEERNIAIIYHGTGLPQGVLSVLQDAQASFVSIVHVEAKEKLGTSIKGSGKCLIDMLAGKAVSSDMPGLDGLIAGKLITVESEVSEKPDTLLLILGEKETVHVEFLREVIESAKQESISLVGLEVSDVKNSVLGELKDNGASTIDNVDTVFGQFSLLSVLRGTSGSFGVKELADEFIATF